MKKNTKKNGRVSNRKKRSKEKQINSSYLDFKNLDKAAEIAYYYGFMPIATPVIKKEDSIIAKKLLDDYCHDKVKYGAFDECPLYMSIEEKIAVLRTCLGKNLLSPSQPTMVYHENLINREGEKHKLSRSYKKIGLDIIGTTKSVAEAILIQTAIDIIKDEGYEDIYIDLNSTGDKESIANFIRELNSWNRKNLNELGAHCKHDLRQNIFHILQCQNKKCEEIAETAPKTVTSLSEQSRNHLKEVLEYIESMNIPYKLDNRLVGDKKVTCYTIFKIVSLGSDKEPEETLALGFRYNGLSKKAEIGKDLPGIGVSIALKRKSGKIGRIKNLKKPKIYFIQLGFEAKIKSLKVIEVLRKAKIPVYQSLSRDKLSSQIGTAEHMKIPISIIMGQKEALENSVIVRNMNTRFQENVPVTELADYLKKFKLV